MKSIEKNKTFVFIYVAYSRPNGWTDRAEFFCGHSWVAVGCYRIKKIENLFFQQKKIIFFSNFFSPRATLGTLNRNTTVELNYDSK